MYITDTGADCEQVKLKEGCHQNPTFDPVVETSTQHTKVEENLPLKMKNICLQGEAHLLVDERKQYHIKVMFHLV